jgi:ribosomal protein L16/L10AE
MGRGVGAINYWVSKVFSGTMLFEISEVNFFLAKNVLNAAKKKLPIKTLVILNPFFFVKYFQPK